MISRNYVNFTVSFLDRSTSVVICADVQTCVLPTAGMGSYNTPLLVGSVAEVAFVEQRALRSPTGAKTMTSQVEARNTMATLKITRF